MILKEAIYEFMINQRVKGNTDSTIDYYNRSLKIFSDYIGENFNIKTLTVKHLNGYYISLSERDLTSTSVQTYIRALRSFLNFCYNEEFVSICLPDKFRLPKARRKVIDILTETEIEKLMKTFDVTNKLDFRNYCICVLMLDCGLRLNEVALLQIENVHTAENYMIVDGKGNKQRFVPFGSTSRKLIEKYLSTRSSERGSLFLSDNGTPITRNAIKIMFQKLKKKSGIRRLKAHLLRHTFATLYLENGGDIYSLQTILGHTSLEMVKKYLHLCKNKVVRNFGKFSPLDNILNIR